MGIHCRMAHIRHLALVLILRQVIKWCVFQGESILVRIILVAKCESGTSESIHCDCHRILFEGCKSHSMDSIQSVRTMTVDVMQWG